jgi:hypothetical protein
MITAVDPRRAIERVQAFKNLEVGVDMGISFARSWFGSSDPLHNLACHLHGRLMFTWCSRRQTRLTRDELIVHFGFMQDLLRMMG